MIINYYMYSIFTMHLLKTVDKLLFFGYTVVYEFVLWIQYKISLHLEVFS